MDLSIVIVNYKTPQLLLDCIASIREQTTGCSYEIVVVDNDSRDPSREWVMEKYPDVKWIQLDQNIGFAGGNNAGLRASVGEYVLLLNSDTIIVDHALEKCVSFMKTRTDKSIAMLGCRLLYPDMTLQLSSMPQVVWPSLKVTFLENVFLAKLGSLFFGVKHASEEDAIILHQSNHYTDSIAGSFMLFEKKLIEESGLLDPDFFMYYEEIEWTHRLLEKNLRIYYWKEASIIHLLGASLAASLSKLQQMNFSKELFMLKRYGKAGYLFFLLASYVNMVSGWIAYPFLSKKSKNDFKEWLAIFLPTSSIHFRILFRYHKKWGSGPGPLKTI